MDTITKGDGFSRTVLDTAIGPLTISAEQREIPDWIPMSGPYPPTTGSIETTLRFDGNFGGIPDVVVVNGLEYRRPISL